MSNTSTCDLDLFLLLSFLPAGVFEPETLSNPIPKEAAEEAPGKC